MEASARPAGDVTPTARWHAHQHGYPGGTLVHQHGGHGGTTTSMAAHPQHTIMVAPSARLAGDGVPRRHTHQNGGHDGKPAWQHTSMHTPDWRCMHHHGGTPARDWQQWLPASTVPRRITHWHGGAPNNTAATA